MYKLVFSDLALKDSNKIAKSYLKQKCQEFLDIIAVSPYQNPPSYKKLVGSYDGRLSRRINIQHRLVYRVHEEEKYVKVLSMWSHYEGL